jgi:hypothetical protein
VLPLGSDLTTISDASQLKTRLNEALARPEIERLVLILDELGALPSSSREALGNALRSFFHDRLVLPSLQKLQIIFSGGVELYTMVVSEVSSLHNVCQEIYLLDLPEAEAVTLLSDGLQAAGVDPALSTALGKAGFAQVAGHPYLTQRVGELLVEYHGSDVTVDAAALQRAIAEIRNSAPPLLRRIRNDLREHQLEDAARRLLIDPPRFTRLDDDMARLELVGLAKPTGEYWAPRNPLLAEVFRELLGLPPVAGPAIELALPEPPPVSEPAPAAKKPGPQPTTVSASAAAPQKIKTVSLPADSVPDPPIEERQPSQVHSPPLDESSSSSRPGSASIKPLFGRAQRLVTIGVLLVLFAGIVYAAGNWIRGASPAQTPDIPTEVSVTAASPDAVASSATPSVILPAWVPEMVEVPAGPFLMGSDDDDPLAIDDEKPQHELELPAYWIGKTEVTNAQFRPFIEGDGYRNPDYWTAAGWQWREQENIVAPEYWDAPNWNGDDPSPSTALRVNSARNPGPIGALAHGFLAGSLARRPSVPRHDNEVRRRAMPGAASTCMVGALGHGMALRAGTPARALRALRAWNGVVMWCVHHSSLATHRSSLPSAWRTTGRSPAAGARSSEAATVTTANVLPSRSKNSTLYPVSIPGTSWRSTRVPISPAASPSSGRSWSKITSS